MLEIVRVTPDDWEEVGRARIEGPRDRREAARVYERFGFRFTGNTEPLPRKPHLIEREMVLEL